MVATCPEELELLLEDALMLHDQAAVAALYEDGLLVSGPGRQERSDDAFHLLTQRAFVASLLSVTVVRGLAVVLGDHTVNVSRRGPDGGWRCVVTLVLPLS